MHCCWVPVITFLCVKSNVYSDWQKNAGFSYQCCWFQGISLSPMLASLCHCVDGGKFIISEAIAPQLSLLCYSSPFIWFWSTITAITPKILIPFSDSIFHTRQPSIWIEKNYVPKKKSLFYKTIENKLLSFEEKILKIYINQKRKIKLCPLPLFNPWM